MQLCVNSLWKMDYNTNLLFTLKSRLVVFPTSSLWPDPALCLPRISKIPESFLLWCSVLGEIIIKNWSPTKTGAIKQVKEKTKISDLSCGFSHKSILFPTIQTKKCYNSSCVLNNYVLWEKGRWMQIWLSCFFTGKQRLY